MDEKYLYLFIRQDLPLAQQIVQTNHATYSLATLLQSEFSIPNIVVIGVPNLPALNRVLKKLKENQIRHYCWNEPDYDFGFTAIATEPLSGQQREILKNYRVWNYGGGPTKVACSLTANSASNSGVAQL